MATYTTQVRSICEQYAGFDESGGFDKIDQAIAGARAHIFTADYPIYQGGTKEALETKILRHYYMREIGLETVGLWKHFLNTRMLEIMPYYRDYVKNSLNNFIAESGIDLTRTISEAISGSSTTDGSTSSTETATQANETERTLNLAENETMTHGHTVNQQTTHGRATTRTGSEQIGKSSTRTPNLTRRDKYSDTPQNGLTAVEQDSFLTNYRAISDTGTETEQGTDTHTYNSVKDQESGTDTVATTNSGADTTARTNTGTDTTQTSGNSEKGITGTQASATEHEQTKTVTDRTQGIPNMKELIEAKARIMELIQNVDMMIISDLSDLFMRIY